MVIEPPEQLQPEGKTYRLDLEVKLFKKVADGGLDEAEILNVEVQTTSYARLTNRMPPYACPVYSSQLSKG